MKKDNKQRLFEMMGSLDKNFKPKLNEEINEVTLSHATDEDPISDYQQTDGNEDQLNIILDYSKSQIFITGFGVEQSYEFEPYENQIESDFESMKRDLSHVFRKGMGMSIPVNITIIDYNIRKVDELEDVVSNFDGLIRILNDANNEFEASQNERGGLQEMNLPTKDGKTIKVDIPNYKEIFINGDPIEEILEAVGEAPAIGNFPSGKITFSTYFDWITHRPEGVSEETFHNNRLFRVNIEYLMKEYEEYKLEQGMGDDFEEGVQPTNEEEQGPNKTFVVVGNQNYRGWAKKRGYMKTITTPTHDNSEYVLSDEVSAEEAKRILNSIESDEQWKNSGLVTYIVSSDEISDTPRPTRRRDPDEWMDYIN